jgi:hypothetical protein
MTYANEYRAGPSASHSQLEESLAFTVSIAVIVVLAFGYYILSTRFHIRQEPFDHLWRVLRRKPYESSPSCNCLTTWS